MVICSSSYIALGWAAIIYLPEFLDKGGVAIFVLILTGGVLYSAGGIIYAIKKPNFSINWFGFHEMFHALYRCGIYLLTS
jgi:hemolysin III